MSAPEPPPPSRPENDAGKGAPDDDRFSCVGALGGILLFFAVGFIVLVPLDLVLRPLLGEHYRLRDGPPVYSLVFSGSGLLVLLGLASVGGLLFWAGERLKRKRFAERLIPRRLRPDHPVEWRWLIGSFVVASILLVVTVLLLLDPYLPDNWFLPFACFEAAFAAGSLGFGLAANGYARWESYSRRGCTLTLALLFWIPAALGAVTFRRRVPATVLDQEAPTPWFGLAALAVLFGLGLLVLFRGFRKKPEPKPDPKTEARR